MRRLAVCALVAAAFWACAVPAGWSETPSAKKPSLPKVKDGPAAAAATAESANYEAMKRVQEAAKRNQEINRIAADYRARRLDGAAARRQLQPLLAAQAAEQAASAIQHIEMLQREIEGLELLKRNRNDWVKAKTEELLGSAGPSAAKPKSPASK